MFKNKKFKLSLVIFIILALVLFMVYRSKSFKLESISPKEFSNSGSNIIFKFNKPVSNRIEIVRDTKIEPSSTKIFIFVEGNTITIKPLIGFSLFTDYKITVPVVSSGNQKVKNVSLKFKVSDLEFNKLSKSEKRIFEDNLNKFNFMNKLRSVDNKDFQIEVSQFNTISPAFNLTLKPNIDDFSNTEFKIMEYQKSFNSFKGYLKSYGFSSEDLNLYLYPSYLHSYLIPSDEDIEYN